MYAVLHTSALHVEQSINQQTQKRENRIMKTQHTLQRAAAELEVADLKARLTLACMSAYSTQHEIDTITEQLRKKTSQYTELLITELKQRNAELYEQSKKEEYTEHTAFEKVIQENTVTQKSTQQQRIMLTTAQSKAVNNIVRKVLQSKFKISNTYTDTKDHSYKNKQSIKKKFCAIDKHSRREHLYATDEQLSTIQRLVKQYLKKQKIKCVVCASRTAIHRLKTLSVRIVVERIEEQEDYERIES